MLFPYRLIQNIEYSSLCYTVGPCCLSVLYIVVCYNNCHFKLLFTMITHNMPYLVRSFSNFFYFLVLLGLRCCAWAFSCRKWGSLSSCVGGFSLQWFLVLRNTGSRHAGFSGCGVRAHSCGAWALECRLRSKGAWAWLLCSMRSPPVPGIDPVSSALAGVFLSTVTTGEVR